MIDHKYKRYGCLQSFRTSGISSFARIYSYSAMVEIWNILDQTDIPLKLQAIWNSIQHILVIVI
jgi:hypothetical protein